MLRKSAGYWSLACASFGFLCLLVLSVLFLIPASAGEYPTLHLDTFGRLLYLFVLSMSCVLPYIGLPFAFFTETKQDKKRGLQLNVLLLFAFFFMYWLMRSFTFF